MNKWKTFVEYDSIKNNFQPQFTLDKLQKNFPGRITNEKLLKNFDKYLRDDNEMDPTNFAVKSKIRDRIDYMMVTEEVWKSLKSKYGGFEIKRQKSKKGYYSATYEIRFTKVSNS